MDSSSLGFAVTIEDIAESNASLPNSTNRWKRSAIAVVDGGLESCDTVSEGDSGHATSEPESADETSNMLRASGEFLLANKTTKDDINVIMSAGFDDKGKDIGVVYQQQVSQSKAALYTTTVGSYVAWNTDVDLGPPTPAIPVPVEDVNIYTYYNALQYTLYETGFPETVSRLDHSLSKADSKDGIAIAVLSSPVECMGILLEGGRQCPGDMLLILSTSWLSKRKSEQKNGLYSLYVLKAISFDSAGRTFLDVYNPPRRVTYFVNFFTRACTDGARNDGEDWEVDLDCPMSSSLSLAHMVDDKLFTRIMMSDVGMAFPETLAFTYCTTLPYDTDCKELTVISLDTKIGIENLMLEEITKFVLSELMQKHEKVVVKPSGVMWHASCGVTYHQRNDITSIWKAALALLAQLEEEDVILVEAFYHTIHPKSNDTMKWAATDQHAARVRSTVCRGGDNLPHMTKVVCGVGLKKDPVNGDNTIPQSLDTTLIMMGVLDAEERSLINNKMKRSSENLLQRIMEYESQMSQSDRGGIGAQTDVIGIDFVLTRIDGTVIPVGIEVNSHDCTINCHMFEFMYPYTAGDAFRPLIENMIARSQRFVMRGKTILVIGAGGYSKKFIWHSAKEFGIEIILIDNDPSHFAAQLVSEFITYDLTDHTQDEVHARNIIHLLAERKVVIDGCITFWEDCGPLAACISDILNLSGPGLRGALAAKKKSATQQILRTRTGDIPHFPRTYLYSSKAFHVDSTASIHEAARQMTFPCMMKLEYGSSAVGVTLVHDVSQCLQQWNVVQEELRGDNSHPGIGLGHGNTMLLMDYIGGTEHDVDIIIYKRRLLGAFVSDNGPTRIPQFTETAAAMPSFLPLDKRRQLIVAAYQCCVEIGLVSGMFNVELKMTSTGPKLIEINARMGGFYLRDWIRALYGVDILLCAFMIACNIRPCLPPNPEPAGQLVGVMTVPSAHRKALSDPATIKLLNLLEDNGVVRVNRLEASLPPPEEDCHEEPYWNIAIMDRDPEAAKTKILGVFNLLGLNSKEYPVEEFLRDFRNS